MSNAMQGLNSNPASRSTFGEKEISYACPATFKIFMISGMFGCDFQLGGGWRVGGGWQSMLIDQISS